jgi:hypothetical protein
MPLYVKDDGTARLVAELQAARHLADKAFF